MDKLKEEAGDRMCISPFKIIKKSYADELPDRVLKRMGIQEEKVE